MVFSGAAQHANRVAGAAYFADSSRKSTDLRIRWRSAKDSNSRYRLPDTRVCCAWGIPRLSCRIALLKSQGLLAQAPEVLPLAR